MSGADIYVEALFSPSFEVLGGAIRPALGASIYFGQVSNASLVDANEGIDTLDIRTGYSFG